MQQLPRAFVAMIASVAGVALGQSPPDPNYQRLPLFATFADFQAELAAISATNDSAARSQRLDSLWSSLRAAGQAPFAVDGRAALLYRGEASSVSFAGDFNGWSPTASRATRVAGTDLWVRDLSLPPDARVDYKVVLNGADWRLDPANPLQVWSGFGPNSELRMPEYEYPVETIRRPGVARGALSANVLTTSAALGYPIQHRVYTPAGYDAQSLAGLPVLYVTDGHEYAADHLGSLVATLDNLIADGSIRPTIAVFVDPRDPSNPANNRRQTEYTNNPAFVRYLTDELVPRVDASYRTSTDAQDRAILGTSLGGIAAALVGATEGDVIAKIGVQSPAFWAAPSIYDLYRRAPTAPIQLYMTAGTINDGTGGPALAAILSQQGYDYQYLEAHEGHSWGNWRAQLPGMLRALVGPEGQLPGDYNRDGQVNAADYTVWRDRLGGGATPSDYDVWVANYGAAVVSPAGDAATAAALAVPAPAGWAMAIVAAAARATQRP